MLFSINTQANRGRSLFSIPQMLSTNEKRAKIIVMLSNWSIRTPYCFHVICRSCHFYYRVHQIDIHMGVKMKQKNIFLLCFSFFYRPATQNYSLSLAVLAKYARSTSSSQPNKIRVIENIKFFQMQPNSTVTYKFVNPLELD